MLVKRNFWQKVFCLFSVVTIIYVTPPVFALDGEHIESKEEATVYWNVHIDERGQTFSSLFVKKENNAPDLTGMENDFVGAFQKALGCTLDSSNVDSHDFGVNIQAECNIPLQKDGLVTRVALKPAALANLLKNLGQFTVHQSISMPKLGFSKINHDGEVFSFGSQTTYTFSFETNTRSIEDLSLEFGYHKDYLIALFTTCSLLLIAPFGLILFVRRRSLALASKDSTAAWYGYWRVHRWIVEGGGIIWIIILSLFNIQAFIRYFFGSEQLVLNVLIFFVPPGILSFLCQFLARPLWSMTRGITWTRREMLARGLFEHVATILPLALLIIGINSFLQQSGEAIPWFIAAAIARPVGSWVHGRVSKITPRPLHNCEFREKTLAMAHNAGVKIKQIFLMPAKHLQMGNAFATVGRKVMITDYLLERLTKQETDCVMAHEIGHVKMRHSILLSWPLMLVMLLLFLVFNSLLSTIISWSLLMINDPIRLAEIYEWLNEYLNFPLALVLTLLTRYFLSRRFEYSADEFATLVTGAPEAMITALVKVSKMNLMPVNWGAWDEKLATHPATIRRANAIAKRHRIPGNRLQALLATLALRGEGEGYNVSKHSENLENADNTSPQVMEISCPSCAFSKFVPLRNLPEKPVRATCPKCGHSFSMKQYVGLNTVSQTLQASNSQTDENDSSSAIKVDSSDKEMKKAVLVKIFPLTVALASYILGAPWYVALFILAMAPYWFGPVVVYSTQRLPAFQPLCAISGDTPLPFEHQLFFDRTVPVLEDAGFLLKGCFTNSDCQKPIRGTVSLMQHRETLDVAHLLVAIGDGRSSELLGFSRARADGSRLLTSWRNIPSPLAPSPQDNTLDIRGDVEPQDLWRVHQARVAADPKVIKNDPIADALDYQVSLERDAQQKRIASGMWTTDRQPEVLRPTLTGALLMCLRTLFPWKQLKRLRGGMEMRRVMKTMK